MKIKFIWFVICLNGLISLRLLDGIDVFLIGLMNFVGYDVKYNLG